MASTLKDRTSVLAATSAATPLFCLHASCTLSAHAARSRMHRLPHRCVGFRLPCTCRSRSVGGARGGERSGLACPHCRSRSVGGVWGDEAAGRSGSLRSSEGCYSKKNHPLVLACTHIHPKCTSRGGIGDRPADFNRGVLGCARHPQHPRHPRYWLLVFPYYLLPAENPLSLIHCYLSTDGH